MTLTMQEVEHIAQLARLNLTQTEKKRYQQQLSDILDHVAQLQKLDTSDIKPASVVQPERARLREDNPGKGLSRKEALDKSFKMSKKKYKNSGWFKRKISSGINYSG